MLRKLLYVYILIMLVSIKLLQAQDGVSLICEQNAQYSEHWAAAAQVATYADFTPPAFDLAVSLDGRQLAFATLRQVIIYDTDNLSEQHMFRTNSTSYFSLSMSISWAPDSQHLAIATSISTPEEQDPQSGVFIWKVDSEEIVNRIPSEPSLMTWSPDGNTIAVVTLPMTASTVVQAWNTETLDDIQIYDIPRFTDGLPFGVSALAWSPDSTLLAGTGFQSRSLVIWDTNDQELQAYTLPAGSSGESLSWSPDGNYLAIGNSVYSRIRLWNTETQEIEEDRTLNNAIGPVMDIQWSSDGRWLAQAGQFGMSLWDMTSNSTTPAHTFDENVPPFVRIAWLPDSQHLISVDFEGSIYRWDIETGCVEAAVLKDWTSGE